jgi:hypothetical protein
MQSVSKALIKEFDQPIDSLADHYQRVREALETSLDYLGANVDLNATKPLQDLTFNEILNLLDPRIEHYKWYVKHSGSGVFRREDDLEHWIKNGH